MKKITFCFILTVLVLSSVKGQTTLFEDDFESYTDFAISDVGSWTLLDIDGLNTYGFTGATFENSGAAKSFQVFNSTATTPALTASSTSNWEGYNSSLKGMVCFASVPSGGVYNDDWLITPMISLAESGNSLSFWYKACDATYSIEQFTVAISTSGTAPEDFTIISDDPISIANGDISWQQFTYDFPGTYDGSDIYIGIHCTSQDQFGFMIDDFSVATTLSIQDFSMNEIKFSCVDRIVTVSNLNGENNYKVISVTGHTIMTGKTTSNSQKIDGSDLSSGIYIIEISNENSGGVVRKKVAI